MKKGKCFYGAAYLFIFRLNRPWPQSGVRVEAASLHFFSLSSDLNGLYVCEAKNAHGRQRGHLAFHYTSGKAPVSLSASFLCFLYFLSGYSTRKEIQKQSCDWDHVSLSIFPASLWNLNSFEAIPALPSWKTSEDWLRAKWRKKFTHSAEQCLCSCQEMAFVDPCFHADLDKLRKLKVLLRYKESVKSPHTRMFSFWLGEKGECFLLIKLEIQRTLWAPVCVYTFFACGVKTGHSNWSPDGGREETSHKV